MELRFVLLGTNVVLVSVVCIALGMVMKSPSLVGVGFSISIVGGTLLALGMGFRGPELEFLSMYSELLRNTVLNVLEDLNLLEHVIVTVPLNEGCVLLFKRSPEVPKELVLPIGLENNEPYLGIVIEKLVEQSEEPAKCLNDLLVGRFGIASRVTVSMENGKVVVNLLGVDTKVARMQWKPFAPLTIFVSASLCQCLGKPLVLLEERIVGDRYSAIYEVKKR